MKTQEQIVERIKEIEENDFFGYETNDLITYLDFEHAKQFIKEEKQAELEQTWKDDKPKDPAEEIKEYMSFAWDKANNCRGLSADRSISHMSAWLWLDGKEELAEEIRDYQYYGKPQLVKICQEYGIDWKQYDNDSWKNEEFDDGITAEQVLK